MPSVHLNSIDETLISASSTELHVHVMMCELHVIYVVQ